MLLPPDLFLQLIEKGMLVARIQWLTPSFLRTVYNALITPNYGGQGSRSLGALEKRIWLLQASQVKYVKQVDTNRSAWKNSCFRASRNLCHSCQWVMSKDPVKHCQYE